MKPRHLVVGRRLAVPGVVEAKEEKRGVFELLALLPLYWFFLFSFPYEYWELLHFL